MKASIWVRNVSLGGRDTLEVHDTVAANDDITIKRGRNEVSVGREDVPKLIAILESFLKVGQDGWFDPRDEDRS